MPLASATQVALSRLTRILLLVAALCLGAPTAGAGAATPPLDDTLAALWKTALQTPTAQNPLLALGCFDLGGTLAPFGGKRVHGAAHGAGPCQVKPGTKIYVAASSAECSTFEVDTPFFGKNEAQLRKCARENDVQEAPTVTVDDKPVPMTEVETPLMDITLPADNILGVTAAQGLQGQSVAHGWVTLLDPLTLGAHTIVGKGSVTFTTKITVQS